MAVKVKDVDTGWKKAVAAMKDARGYCIKVGLQGEEAEADHGGVTVVELGTIHEYGAPQAGIPSRSFIRATFDEHRKELEQEVTEAVRKGTSGKEGHLKGQLLIVGERMRSRVIAKIRAGIPPELKPATVARKGGETTPLIDTGVLIGSLSTVVDKEK